MKIHRAVHKGLRRLLEDDDTSGFQPVAAEKIRKILSFLEAMEGVDELRHFPNWRPHQLSSRRKDVWSLTVTANWRITFKIDPKTNAIIDLNYEDYH